MLRHVVSMPIIVIRVQSTCVAGTGANGPTYKGDSDGKYYCV